MFSHVFSYNEDALCFVLFSSFQTSFIKKSAGAASNVRRESSECQSSVERIRKVNFIFISSSKKVKRLTATGDGSKAA
jgi:hypothetical protein